MTLDAVLLDHIKNHPGATFVELQWAGERAGFQMRGNMELGNDAGGHMILWLGMSEQFCQAIRALLESGQVGLKYADRLIYLVDGATLPLPVAVRPPKNGYKTDHWLPVVLHPIQAIG